MALEGEELWDDTVLIKAFDRAISTFKVMHGKEGEKISSMGGEVICREKRNSAGLVSESNEVKRDFETNVNNVASRTETEETTNSSLDKGSLVDDNGTGHNMSSSNGQTSHNTYSNTEATEDYNLLLSEYYQVEEQRQKILHQLYQYGSWNYGDYDSSIQWGTNSASYEQEVPTQASGPTDSIATMDGTSASQEHQVLLPTQSCCSAVACCCCSCMCPGLVGPGTSLPACTLSGTCVGEFGHNTLAAGQNGKSSSVVKDDLVKTAMEAADRALSALKTKVSCDANTSQDKVTKLETDVGKLAQSCSSKTDLTVVFNAWYSAGFYTCKYLMEQSAAKK